MVFDVPVVATAVESCDCGPGTDLQLSGEEAANLATVLKALAHPIRLQMMDILSRQDGQVCVCEIESHFTLTQPTISHHLKILRDAGLIVSEQRGLWVYHRVQPNIFDPVRQFLAQLGT